MAITLVPMTCPQCGAQVDAPVDRDECFCMYCGTKILINNDNMKTININKTTHVVDEAKLAEAGNKKYVILGVFGLMIIIIIMSIVNNTFGIMSILLVMILSSLVIAPGHREKERKDELEREKLKR